MPSARSCLPAVRLRWLLLTLLLATQMAWGSPLRDMAADAAAGAATGATQEASALPPVRLDALDPDQWSMSSLIVAPGQTILVTNRGVQPHTFTVLEWGIDVPLPSLETVEIVVPPDVRPGDTYTFFCSEPGHRALGQEGTITVVTPEEILTGQDAIAGNGAVDRVVLETRDDFSWSLQDLRLAPGQILEIRNPGVLEHHFVVDEWAINETISAGETKLVQVPADLQTGQTFVFYCSVPGHRQQGEEGTITIVEPVRGGPVAGALPTNDRIGQADLGRFLPEPGILGPGWSEVRSGNARAVIPELEEASARIFPGEGRGATYIGPAGSRATIIVLPFATSTVPANQIEDGIAMIQQAMMREWETDLNRQASLDRIEPPVGCDLATRAIGVTRVYTLPAGSTVCQVRSAGVAIFVAIEGAVGAWTSIEAADQVIVRLLQTL